jgi:hypothetical protein
VYEDVTTPQLHTTTLAEAVAADRPQLDDQSTTPPHTSSKEGLGHSRGQHGAAAGSGGAS